MNSARPRELEQWKLQKQFPLQWQQLQPIVQDILRNRQVTKLDWCKITPAQAKICLYDGTEGAEALYSALQEEIVQSISEARERILANNKDELCLLRAYIQEWTNFFALSDYFFRPFQNLEKLLTGNKHGPHGRIPTKANSIVRKLMLNTWNESIFAEFKEFLQCTTMKLVHAERNGEVFDSDLVTEVRQSYVNLCTDNNNHLTIYYDHFEKAYLETTKDFYNAKCQEYLAANGIYDYMAWADAKLKEEEERAKKYLETTNEYTSMERFMYICVQVFVASFKDLMLAEAAQMIRDNETEKLALMFGLLSHIPGGTQDLETLTITQGLADMAFSAETNVADPEPYVENHFSMRQ